MWTSKYTERWVKELLVGPKDPNPIIGILVIDAKGQAMAHIEIVPGLFILNEDGSSSNKDAITTFALSGGTPERIEIIDNAANCLASAVLPPCFYIDAGVEIEFKAGVIVVTASSDGNTPHHITIGKDYFESGAMFGAVWDFADEGYPADKPFTSDEEKKPDPFSDATKAIGARHGSED